MKKIRLKKRSDLINLKLVKLLLVNKFEKKIASKLITIFCFPILFNFKN